MGGVDKKEKLNLDVRNNFLARVTYSAPPGWLVIDLTAASSFWLVNHNDSSSWLDISSLPPICSPGLSFIGGVEKKKTKLGCENYYFLARVTYSAGTSGDAALITIIIIIIIAPYISCLQTKFGTYASCCLACTKV